MLITEDIYSDYSMPVLENFDEVEVLLSSEAGFMNKIKETLVKLVKKAAEWVGRMYTSLFNRRKDFAKWLKKTKTKVATIPGSHKFEMDGNKEMAKHPQIVITGLGVTMGTLAKSVPTGEEGFAGKLSVKVHKGLANLAIKKVNSVDKTAAIKTIASKPSESFVASGNDVKALHKAGEKTLGLESRLKVIQTNMENLKKNLESQDETTELKERIKYINVVRPSLVAVFTILVKFRSVVMAVFNKAVASL